ncbi:uncharacterized protein LOC119589449 [Penaeus monodon]|uniref:uncharacterized protein LOC119589449 n=1 Tax=Penaeus monodon TaxID=6687 RepID=UPI0018A79BCF|nr:uncharacterized protein LOC119589449 [Penaeus monodon]
MKTILSVFGFLMVAMALASSDEVEDDDDGPVYYYTSPILPLVHRGTPTYQAHYISLLPFYSHVATQDQGAPGTLRLYNPAEDIDVNPEIDPSFYIPYIIEKKKKKE